MALTSFFSALTGLNANSHTINVIGDNLANMNTIGFKAGKATFAEIIGGMSGFSATGNPIVFGQGAMLNGIVHKQTPGTPEYTGNSTDAMINGSGYFVVSTGDGGIGYTRGGRFQFDGSGNLVSSDGYQIMGYGMKDGKVDTTSGITTLDVRMGQFVPARPTAEMYAAINLDSRIDQADVNNTFATSIQIYDSLGSQHTVKLTFTKDNDAGDVPEWLLTVDLLDKDGNVAHNFDTDIELEFDEYGKLVIPATDLTLTIEADWFGDGLPGANADLKLLLRDDVGNSLITSAAAASGTSMTHQNGYASSTLKSVAFNEVGMIIGLAENGNSVDLGQLALAVFPNIEGLQKYTGSTFIASSNAGEPSIGTANSGGRGKIYGGSLEMSNVDMAEEFINLIIAQRAFQANARVITTSDELYQEAIHLKR